MANISSHFLHFPLEIQLGSSEYMAQLEHIDGPPSLDRERTAGRGEKIGEVRVGESIRERAGNTGDTGDAMP